MPSTASASIRGYRLWQQEVGIMDGIGVLVLSHPDGRVAVHYFDAVLLAKVASYNWYHADGYARSNSHGYMRLHWLCFELASGEGRYIQVDHKDRKKDDSRSCNLEIGSARNNQHNKKNQSAAGTCISITRVGSYLIQVTFNGMYSYRPTFRRLGPAMTCRDAFLAIAHEHDAGKRGVPTKAELKGIVDALKNEVEG